MRISADAPGVAAEVICRPYQVTLITNRRNSLVVTPPCLCYYWIVRVVLDGSEITGTLTCVGLFRSSALSRRNRALDFFLLSSAD